MSVLDIIQGVSAVGMIAFGMSGVVKRFGIRKDKLGSQLVSGAFGFHVSLAVFLVCAVFRYGKPGFASWESSVLLVGAGLAICRAILTCRAGL